MNPKDEENLKVIINDLYHCIDGLLKRSEIMRDHIEDLQVHIIRLEEKIEAIRTNKA